MDIKNPRYGIIDMSAREKCALAFFSVVAINSNLSTTAAKVK